MLIGLPQIPNLSELLALFRHLKIGDEVQANTLIDNDPSLCNTRVPILDNVNPLICSVQYQQTQPSLDFFNFLVAGTEDLNAQNRLGFGAVHFLAGYNRADLLEALVQNMQGTLVNVDLQNETGNTAAHIASQKNAVRALYTLIQHKAEPNIANAEGQTPLHIACLHGNSVCVSLLLSVGAKVNVPDNHKRTPMHYLAQSKADGSEKNKIFEILLNFGANVNEKSEHEKTAHEMAMHFKTGDQFIDTIAKNRVPSLYFLCTQAIIKEFSPTKAELDEANLPEIIQEHIIKNMRSCGK